LTDGRAPSGRPHSEEAKLGLDWRLRH